MKRIATVFTRVAVLLGVALLAACSLSLRAPEADICAQGASAVNPLISMKPGIGGTGAVAARPGLGGTGLQAGGVGGTGIVGVVTGFASICVNGVEVHLDADTPVSDNGEPAQARQLALGQLVVVRASGTGSQLRARDITLAHAAVGPVEAVNAATGDFQLLGQRAHALDSAMLRGVKAGDWIKVGGHRMADGQIAASHIEPVAAQTRAQLLGVLRQDDAGALMIDGARLAFAGTSAAAALAPGLEVLVSGTWDGRALTAQSVQIDPVWSSLGGVEQVLVEGYLDALGERQISVGQRRMSLGVNSQVVTAGGVPLALNQHVTVTGRIGPDRSIMVDRVEASGGSGRGRAGASGRTTRVDGKSTSGSSRIGSSGSGSSGSGSGSSGSGSGSSGSDSSGSGSGSSGGGSGSSGSGKSGN